MSEIHFRLHFSPFQIKRQLSYFSKWPLATIFNVRNSFWMSQIDFGSKRNFHFSATLSETIQQCQSAAHLVRCKQNQQHLALLNYF
jgi:hypothetical protein